MTPIRIPALRCGLPTCRRALQRRRRGFCLEIGFYRLPEKTGIFAAFKKGFDSTVDLTAATARALWGFFGKIFSGEGSFESVSGPVGIVNVVGDFSRFGFVFLVQLTALLSINLGLINVIPFPGLDGGRMLVILLEEIKGSPFHWKFTRRVHAAGFVLLIMLMIL